MFILCDEVEVFALIFYNDSILKCMYLHQKTIYLAMIIITIQGIICAAPGF